METSSVLLLILLITHGGHSQMTSRACQSGQECCADVEHSNPDESDGSVHCDVLVSEDFLEVNNGDTVSLSCDPHIEGVAVAVCKWTTPAGVECRFSETPLGEVEKGTPCSGDPAVTFQGSNSAGCNIRVDEIDKDKHDGHWKCVAGGALPYTDDVDIVVCKWLTC